MNPYSQQVADADGWPPFESVAWMASVEPARGSAARHELMLEGLEIVPKTFGELHIRCRRDFHRTKVVPKGTDQ